MIGDAAVIHSRLQQIQQACAHDDRIRALVVMGSGGPEQQRLDRFSDLDFFLIVREDHKATFLEEYHWLADVYPVVYTIQISQNGRKLLFADGLLCEVGVFTESETQAPELKSGGWSSPRQVLWQAADYNADTDVIARVAPIRPNRTLEWMLGEALTNLFTGMNRYLRGEKLSAMRFVEHYALDRILELASLLEGPQPVIVDDYLLERRFEQQFPQTAVLLPQMMQGYGRLPHSVRAILGFLDENFTINQAIKQMILEMCIEAERV